MVCIVWHWKHLFDEATFSPRLPITYRVVIGTITVGTRSASTFVCCWDSGHSSPGHGHYTHIKAITHYLEELTDLTWSANWYVGSLFHAVWLSEMFPTSWNGSTSLRTRLKQSGQILFWSDRSGWFTLFVWTDISVEGPAAMLIFKPATFSAR